MLGLLLFGCDDEARPGGAISEGTRCEHPGVVCGRWETYDTICSSGGTWRRRRCELSGSRGGWSTPAYAAPVCLDCGDGVCEVDVEDECNCLEDCHPISK